MASSNYAPMPSRDISSHSYDEEYVPLGTYPHTHDSQSTLGTNHTHAFRNDDPSAQALMHDHSTLHPETGNGFDRSSADTGFTRTEQAIKHPAVASTRSRYNDKDSSGSLKCQRAFDLKDWKWEFAAAAFSLACFAAVVTVLAVFQNKSLSSWNFVYDITLNTLVALLSTLSRTALMVPVASCISQLKWIHLVGAPRPLSEAQVFDDASRGPWGSLELIWKLNFKTKLASWGSIITILTLTMGPFAQQLISYPSRPIYTPVASFYASQVYDSGTSRGVTAAWMLDRKMDPKMQGAILNGLYDLSSPVQSTCPTGNCKWNDTATLAVASSCKNVTSDTKVWCENLPRASKSCNYTTPAGFVLKSSSYTSSGGGSFTYFNTSARYQSSTNGKGPINSSIVSFAMASMKNSMNMSLPDVTECTMNWCARLRSNIEVKNGTFHPGNFTDMDLSGINNTYQQPGVTQMWDTFQAADDQISFPEWNKTFSISPTDNRRIKEFLQTIFSSTMNDPFGLALYNASDLGETVASISSSMTYALGQGRSGTNLTGDAITMEQYIQVNWPWISLPFAEVVMGIAFLLCTLMHTRRKGVVAWKSSGIVPLLTVMEGWESKELTAASWRELEQRSEHMRGLLEPNQDDVQCFKRVDS